MHIEAPSTSPAQIAYNERLRRQRDLANGRGPRFPSISDYALLTWSDSQIHQHCQAEAKRYDAEVKAYLDEHNAHFASARQ